MGEGVTGVAFGPAVVGEVTGVGFTVSCGGKVPTLSICVPMCRSGLVTASSPLLAVGRAAST
jgi:hypothetical protein